MKMTNQQKRIEKAYALQPLVNGAMKPTTLNRVKKYACGELLILYRNPAPDGVVVDLYYIDSVQTRNNAGNLISTWRYRVNSAFDPDPLLGTGAIPGFVEWAAFYDRYRVLDFMYDAQFSNLEAFPLQVVAAPSLLDLGANYASAVDIPGFPYGTKSLISTLGGQDRARLSGHLDLEKFEGSPTIYTDNNYSGVVSGNPTNVRFMNFGLVSDANLVHGVFISMKLGFRTLFYQRLNTPA